MKRLKFNFRSKKTALVAVAAVAVIGAGVFGYKQATASSQDCSGNSIIKCGEQSPSAFINQVKKNDDKNGHHDLQAIYSSFDLVPSDYSKFVSSARMGTAYQNGTIVVDGQTVATDAWSIGRDHFSYATAYKINGKTYYKSADTKVLLSNIPVMVMFNSKGQMQFAAMTACGNPATGKKVTPKYSCDLLQKSAVSGKANTYNFSTKASASQNAKVVKVVYDFGDGSGKVTETSLSKQVQHTYGTAGTFTAKVTVYVSLPGKQTVTVTSANCETKITVTPPPKPYQQCVDLTATPVDAKTFQYNFVATTKQGNGATLKNASFDFGDGNTANNVSPSGNSTVSVNHTFAKPSKTTTYTINATVNFNTADGVKSENCQAQVTLTPPPAPYQACVALNSFVTDETQRAVRFTVTTKQGNGSVLKSADFDFGDGSNAKNVSPASDSSVVSNHTFGAAGTYNITATVRFNTPDGEKSDNCTTSVTFAPVPAPVCDGLSLTKLGGREVKVVVSYTADGATLQTVTYNFGDGSQPLTTPDTTATYTYANDGNYSVTAALTFLVNGQTKVVSSDSCAQSVTFTTPTCTAPNGKTYLAGSPQCTPPAETCTAPSGKTYPVGSAQCKPAPTCTAPNGQTFPMGSSQCTPQPTTLVNTGPGGIIGLFAGASAIGTAVYRFVIGRRLIRG